MRELRSTQQPGQPDRCLGVMMPVYNEAATLATVIGHVLKSPYVAQLVIVDNGSEDGGPQIIDRFQAQDARVDVVRLFPNRGKGGAIVAAIPKLRTEYAIVQDADLEYDPRDYGRLLEPMRSGYADIVYGVRGFHGHTAHSFWFVMGNRFVTLVANLLFNCFINDIETGYKLLRTSLWKRLELRPGGFSLDPQITGRLLRLGYRIHEVPIRYYARGKREGKKLSWRDGFVALATLLGLRLAPRGMVFASREDDYHAERQQSLAEHHPLSDISVWVNEALEESLPVRRP